MFATHCKTKAFFSKYHSHARRGSFFRWIFAPIFVDISLPCCMALILALFFLCFTTIFSRNVNAARGFCLKYHSHAAWGSFFQRYFGNWIHIEFCPPARHGTIWGINRPHNRTSWEACAVQDRSKTRQKHYWHKTSNKPTIQNLQYKPTIPKQQSLQYKPTIQTYRNITQHYKPTIQKTYNTDIQHKPTIQI